jgi:hypothetical protein
MHQIGCHILSIIWCSNTVTIFIYTFKQKWSSWTSPHWAWLIDTLSISSINLSRNNESFDIQTPHNRSTTKETPNHTTRDQVEMASLRTIYPRRNTRRETRRQTRTRGNGVSTVKFLGTKPVNVTLRSPLWPS